MAQTTVPTARPGGSFSFNEGKIRRDMLMRRVGRIGLIFNPIFSYFFLWVPILLLVIFSFSNTRSMASFECCTTQWYQHILNNVVGNEARFSTGLMIDSLGNSVIVALCATLISTSIGTMVALSLVRGNYPGKQLLDNFLYLPVVIPEITQGVSLLIFFYLIFDFVDKVTGSAIHPQLGFATIIIGHVAFNISYVAIVVRARLADMNPHLEEAARDLGANEWRTFWRITFPLILPGVIAGALLAFTLSLDDFVISFFTAGPGTSLLPLEVYNKVKRQITPKINAVSTVMLLFSMALVLLSQYLQRRRR